MTTERMTSEALRKSWNLILAWCGVPKVTAQAAQVLDDVADEMERSRRVEQEQAEKIRQLERKVLDLEVSLSRSCNETAEFKDQLRLANDKMAEQVRQARLELLEEVMGRAPTIANADRRSRFWEWLNKAHNANAPKD